MMSTECEEFLEQVKHHFDYLFHPYDFVVVGQNEPNTDRCLLVLQAGECRIRLIHNRGDIELYLGTREAPVSWADSIDDTRQWFYLKEVVRFLQADGNVDLEDLLRPVPFMSNEQKLAERSGELRPFIGQVCELFRRDVFEHRRAEFEQFQQEVSAEVRRQLDERQRKQLQRYRGPAAHS